MSIATTRVIRKQGGAGFIVDLHSLDRSNGGRQINWAAVTATNADGKKFLPAGTVVGDLAGSGKVGPRVATTNPAIGLLETDATEGDLTAAITGYGVIVGGVLHENLLPDATGTPKTLPAAIKTELSAAGSGFAFLQYQDTRS